MKIKSLLLAALWLVSIKALFASDANVTLVQTITAPNTNLASAFGRSVFLYRDKAYISAPNSSGAVYVYRHNTEGNYIYEQELPLSTSQMGYSFSADNDYLVFGSEQNTVAIYKIKDDGNYTEVQTLSIPGGQYFGFSVSVNLPYIIIGEAFDDTTYKNSGSVHIYKKNETDDTFQKITKLTSDEPSEGALFGINLAMDNNYLVIGAHDANKAYVYLRNDDDTFQKIVTLEPFEDVKEYGLTVAIQDNYIAVAAAKSNVVYIYKLNKDHTYKLLQKVEHNVLEAISFDGRYLLLGEHTLQKAHLYYREANETYTLQHSFTPTTPAGHFGLTVALEDDSILIGAFAENHTYAYNFNRRKSSEFPTANLPVIPPCCGFESNGTVLTDDFTSVTLQNDQAPDSNLTRNLSVIDLKPDGGDVSKFTPFTLYRIDTNLTNLTLKDHSPYAALTKTDGVVSVEFTRSGNYNLTLTGEGADGTLYSDVSTFTVLNSAPLSKDGNLTLEQDTEISLSTFRHFFDPDPELLDFAIALSPAHGALTLSEQYITYRNSGGGGGGADAFRITATDSDGLTATADFNVTLTEPALSHELTLNPHWNLVGNGFGATPLSTASFLRSGETVWVFDAQSQTWSSTEAGALSIAPGQGFWMHVDDARTQTLTPEESAVSAYAAPANGWAILSTDTPRRLGQYNFEHQIAWAYKNGEWFCSTVDPNHTIEPFDGFWVNR